MPSQNEPNDAPGVPVADSAAKRALVLTDLSRAILQAMADGHEMVFSQDGDMAWLWPKHSSGFLDDMSVIALRKAGYIADAPDDGEDHGRFGPPTIITDAGRAALALGSAA